MAKKTRAEPMQAILSSLRVTGDFHIIIFTDEMVRQRRLRMNAYVQGGGEGGGTRAFLLLLVVADFYVYVLKMGGKQQLSG